MRNTQSLQISVSIVLRIPKNAALSCQRARKGDTQQVTKPYKVSALFHLNITVEILATLHPCQQSPSTKPACEQCLGYNKALHLHPTNQAGIREDRVRSQDFHLSRDEITIPTSPACGIKADYIGNLAGLNTTCLYQHIILH